MLTDAETTNEALERLIKERMGKDLTSIGEFIYEYIIQDEVGLTGRPIPAVAKPYVVERMLEPDAGWPDSESAEAFLDENWEWK